MAPSFRTQLSLGMQDQLSGLFGVMLLYVSAFGTMRSVTFGQVNATSSLLAAACELSYTRCNDSLADALADADVILAAAAMSFPLAQSSRHSAVFTLTLTGKSQVLLHANQRSFSASMTVTLGIVPCSIFRSVIRWNLGATFDPSQWGSLRWLKQLRLSKANCPNTIEFRRATSNAFG